MPATPKDRVPSVLLHKLHVGVGTALWWKALCCPSISGRLNCLPTSCTGGGGGSRTFPATICLGWPRLSTSWATSPRRMPPYGQPPEFVNLIFPAYVEGGLKDLSSGQLLELAKALHRLGQVPSLKRGLPCGEFLHMRALTRVSTRFPLHRWRAGGMTWPAFGCWSSPAA